MLAAGMSLRPYGIPAPPGAAGTGDVRRARDSPLGRGLAPNAVHPEITCDPARFRRLDQDAHAASGPPADRAGGMRPR